MKKEETAKTGELSHFQIPTNLDLISLIHEKLGEKEGKKHLKHLPKYYYFLHLIYSLRKNNPECTVNSYINISYNQLAQVITSNYINKIKSNLVDWDIIEVNGHYLAGSFSKSYRLSNLYRNQQSRLIKNSSENIERNHIKRSDNKTKDLLSNVYLSEYKFLRDCLLHTHIRYSMAMYVMKAARRKKIQLKDKEIKSSKGYYYRRTNRTFNDDTYNSYLTDLNLVRSGALKFDICKTTNRIYSMITSLPTLLRPFLTYQNKSFIYLDISSSQPYFFFKLLNEKKNQMTLEERMGKGKGNNLMSSDFIKEVETYKELLSTGNLYKHFENLLIAKGICFSDPKDVKKLLFKYWFYCKPSAKTNLIKETFRNAFPNISIYIDSLKKDNYKALANQLTKLESEAITRIITLRIYNEVNSAFLLTIHDGLLVLPDQFDEIYNILIEELEIFVGIKPHIKIENFKKEIKKIEGTIFAWKPVAPNILPKRQPLHIPFAA